MTCEPAELLHRRVDDALAEVLGGDVAVAGHGLAAQLLDERDGLLGRRVVEVVHHHRGAVARQPQRHLLPDAAPEPVTIATLPSSCPEAPSCRWCRAPSIA